MDAWLQNKTRLRASTVATYTTAVDWWRARIGDYVVSEIEPLDVSETLAGAREAGDKPETLDGKLRVLRTFARESGVARIVEGVRVERSAREEEDLDSDRRSLSLPELRRFLTAGPTAQLGPDGEPPASWRRAWAFVATLAWTGLRFSEACALEWADVDLETRTIRVRRRVVRGVEDKVKSKASRRTVVIPAELAELLREHRRALLAGQQVGVDSPLVFPSRRPGKAYVTNGHARKAMLRICKAARVELGDRPAVHCLRHTHNNLLRQTASELVRRAQVGHADSAIGEVYSHVEIEERRAAVDAVVRLVRGGGE